MIISIHAVDTVCLLSSPELRRENTAFYGNILGLTLKEPFEDEDFLVFKLHQRELRIKFTSCFEVNRNSIRVSFEVDDLLRVREKLSENGFDPEFSSGYSLASQRIYVYDPTGYRIELFQLYPIF